MEQENLFPSDGIKEEVGCLYDTARCDTACKGCPKVEGEKNIKEKLNV